MEKEALIRLIYTNLPIWAKMKLDPLRMKYWDYKSLKNISDTVKESAELINRNTKNHHGKKILIDCGFNSGQTTKSFIDSLSQEFRYYGFEANEDLFNDTARDLRKKYPQIIDVEFAAVSDSDGEVEFYVDDADVNGVMPGQGNSVHKRDILNDTPHKIKSIDLSSWLRKLWNDNNDGERPYIAIKMDIEGSEYDVLEKMIKDETIDMVDFLMVEYHSRIFSEDEQALYIQREKNIQQALKARNIPHKVWV